MRFQLQHLRIALAEVFADPWAAMLAAVLSALVFLGAVWFPNWRVIAQVHASAGEPLAASASMALKLLGGIGTNFTPLAAGYTIVIAVLFGVVNAMILHLLRRRRAAAARQGAAVGAGAAVSGVLGVGCAACGSAIVAVLAPALGAAGAFAALPLQGEEFGLASAGLLLLSLLLVSKGIATSGRCPLPAGRGAPPGSGGQATVHHTPKGTT